jgi:hypothetical protein
LLPELEALQYKEATPLKKLVSQLTDQVLLATENSAVVAQAPWSVLPPPTEKSVVVAQAPWSMLPPTTKIENSAIVAQAPWPVLPPPTENPVFVAQAPWPVLPPTTKIKNLAVVAKTSWPVPPQPTEVTEQSSYKSILTPILTNYSSALNFSVSLIISHPGRTLLANSPLCIFSN